jgi:putative membrane protein insertion efficiency factor
MQFYEKYKHAWRRFVILPVRLYQKTLSFDHGPLKGLAPYGACPFYPTCSQYMCEAVLKFGLIKGGVKGVGRIGRCHPWSEGGVDKP